MKEISGMGIGITESGGGALRRGGGGGFSKKHFRLSEA